MLLISKREQSNGASNNTDESQKYYTEWKEPDSKEYILYDSIYMKL